MLTHSSRDPHRAHWPRREPRQEQRCTARSTITELNTWMEGQTLVEVSARHKSRTVRANTSLPSTYRGRSATPLGTTRQKLSASIMPANSGRHSRQNSCRGARHSKNSSTPGTYKNHKTYGTMAYLQKGIKSSSPQCSHSRGVWFTVSRKPKNNKYTIRNSAMNWMGWRSRQLRIQHSFVQKHIIRQRQRPCKMETAQDALHPAMGICG